MKSVQNISLKLYKLFSLKQKRKERRALKLKGCHSESTWTIRHLITNLVTTNDGPPIKAPDLVIGSTMIRVREVWDRGSGDGRSWGRRCGTGLWFNGYSYQGVTE